MLLDDVISAVDAQTAQHILRYCFQGPLMAGRTVIIASHAVESLAPLAEQAIFLDAGRVVWQGTGPEMMSSEHMKHLKTETADSSHSQEGFERDVLMNRRSTDKTDEDGAALEIKETPLKTPKQLIVEDEQAEGAIDGKYWRELLHLNGGKSFWLLLATILILSVLAPVAERRVLE